MTLVLDLPRDKVYGHMYGHLCSATNERYKKKLTSSNKLMGTRPQMVFSYSSRYFSNPARFCSSISFMPLRSRFSIDCQIGPVSFVWQALLQKKHTKRHTIALLIKIVVVTSSVSCHINNSKPQFQKTSVLGTPMAKVRRNDEERGRIIPKLGQRLATCYHLVIGEVAHHNWHNGELLPAFFPNVKH